MKTIKAFIKSHPLLSFFALAFTISWGGILIVVGGPGGFPATEQDFTSTLFVFVMLAWLAGPSVAGILMTGLLYGRAGLRDLLTRMTRWRVGARWYAVVLLTAPLLMTAVLLGLSLAAPEYLPRLFITEDKAFLLQFGISAGLTVGIFEELGWTGFAVPRMRLRYGVLGTGLIVGLVVAAWTFLMTFWATDATSTAGSLSLALFLPAALFTWLPAFRVLMVWVYDRTESLLLAILMHASLIASQTSLTSLALTKGMPVVISNLVVTVVLWVFVAAVAVANHGYLARRPPPRRQVA